MTIYQILEFFLIYSFLGWCLEVVYAALKTGTVINRGFLNGAVCPIYGFGVVAIFGLINIVGEADKAKGGELAEANALVIFVGGVILATLIELIGGWALDKLFHTRWWDYSQRKFNFHGYICLEFSLIWGVGILLVVRVIHPAIAEMSARTIPENIGWILMAVFYALYLLDFAVSVAIMVGLNRRIRELDEMRQDMRKISDELSTRLGKGTIETAGKIDEAKLQAAVARAEIEQNLADRHEESRRKAEEARHELKKRVRAHSIYGTGRVLRAFPDMVNHEHPEILQELKKSMKG